MNRVIWSLSFPLAMWLVLSLDGGVIGVARADSAALDRFGINVGLHEYDYVAECDEIIASGVRWVRLSPSWESFEPSKGVFDPNYLAKMDYIVDTLTSHGVKILWILAYMPRWASDAPADSSYQVYSRTRPADWADWEDYVAWVTDRYQGKVFHWEVWNEEDSTAFWLSGVDDYRTLLVKASAKIRAADPNNVVLLGGLRGDGASFLSDLVDGASTAASFDIVNYHTYADSPGMVLAYKTYTGVMNSKNIADRKIWISELGYSTDEEPSLEYNKADWVDQAYITHFSMPGIDRVFWYTYVNTDTGDDHEDNFGLEDAGRNPLEAHAYYQAENGAESNFLLQHDFPTLAADRLTLSYVDASTGDGVVQDDAPDGSRKLIPIHHYLYCRVNNDWIYGNNGGLDPTVNLEVTYFDSGNNSWQIQYQSQISNTQTITVSRNNTNQWQTATFALNDINFVDGQNWQSDFRIFAGSVTPLAVSRIVVRREMNVGRVILGATDRWRLLEHLVDGDTASAAYSPAATIGGRECRMIPGAGKYMFFKICDGLIRTIHPNVTVRIRYYDQGTDNITIQYVSTTSDTAYVTAPPITKQNTNTWKIGTFVLTDAKFDNSKAYHSDFRIYTGIDGSPEYVDMVEAFRN